MHRLLKLLFAVVSFVMSQQCYAQKISASDSLGTLLSSSTDTLRVNLLNKLSSLYAKSASKKSLAYGEEAIALAEKLDFQSGLAMSYRSTGVAWFFNNDHQKAIEYLLRSANKAQSIGNWGLEAQNYLNIAGTYSSVLGNYVKAMEYYSKALNSYESHNIVGKTYDAYIGIAGVYNHQKEYEKALEYFMKSLKLLESKDDKSALGITTQNIGDVYKNKNQLAEAEKYYLRSLENFKAAQIRGGTIISLVKLSDIYRLRQDFDKALINDLEAYSLSEKSTYEREQLYSIESLGETYLGKKEYTKSKAFFERSVAIAQRAKMIEKLMDNYQSLAELSVLTKDFEKAYQYQKLHTAYADSVKSKERINQLAEMEVRFETDRKEKENQLLKKDNDLNKLYTAIASISLISFIVIGVLFFNRQRIKAKSIKALNESEKKILAIELSNTQLSEAKLRTEIDYKNKSLTTYALSMVQKNEILEEVRESVELILKKPDNHEEHFKKLSKVVDYSFTLEKDWDEFKIYFEDVHNDFFVKLRERFPDLGGADLKLCALIRLNLNMKQSAAILRISPDSVKIARHRLRKKFSMQTEDNLNGFIMAL